MPEVRPPPLDPMLLRRVVEMALEEDAARRDITTQALVPPEQRGIATITVKGQGVLAGLPVAATVFAALDQSLRLEALLPEGASVGPATPVARIEGALAPVLSGERVALNFLQRLSGVATATRQLVEATAGAGFTGRVRIVDTRKTTPGLRTLERYAVRVGGGRNHRFNLADGVLIKDNHIAVIRARGDTIAQAIQQMRLAAPHVMRVEIEVTTVDQAIEALTAGADVLLLDNMPVDEMRRAVEAARGRALTEASGGVTLENVRAIAETGVDVISVGGITHSAPALDMSLTVEG
ncbi:MAG: carboxylating nicotinate-nucleotide diphosphorylase [Dehalococcoidia bacterium]